MAIGSDGYPAWQELDGEDIKDDTIDEDSIDFSSITLADFTDDAYKYPAFSIASTTLNEIVVKQADAAGEVLQAVISNISATTNWLSCSIKKINQ